MKKYVVIFSLSFHLILYTNINGQEVTFEKYNISNGLSQNSVFAIEQDTKGFLWLGTQDGLNRFDGRKFRIFRPEKDNPNSLPSHWVTSIIYETDSTFLIGTYDGGLSRFSTVTYLFNRILDLPKNKVWSILSIPNHSIWVGTDDGLFFKQPTDTIWKSANTEFNFEGTSEQILSLTYDSTFQTVIVGTSGGCDIINLKSKSVDQLLGSKHSIFNSVFTIRKSRFKKHIYLIGTLNGMVQFNIQTKQWGTLFSNEGNMVYYNERPSAYSSLNRFNEFTVRDIAELDENRILMATDNGFGVHNKLSKANTWYKHQSNNLSSISNDVLRRFYIDRNNNLWIGTASGGLNKMRLEPTVFTKIGSKGFHPHSLSDGNVRSILIDNKKRIWIGTLGGGIDVLDSTLKKIFNFNVTKYPSMMQSNIWSSIMYDSNTYIFGTGRGLIIIKEQNDEFAVGGISDPREFYVRSLMKDSRANLWVGTESGIRVYNKQFQLIKRFNLETIPAISDVFIYSLVEDKNGFVWAATNNGLNKISLKKNTIEIFHQKLGDETTLSHPVIRNLFMDSNDQLWAATNDGLSVLNADGNSFTSYGLSTGFLNTYFYAVSQDNSGLYWVSSNYGLFSFNRDSLMVKAYDTFYGLQSMEFNTSAVAKDNSGNLYFGGPEGLNIINPTLVKVSNFKPFVAVSNITIDGKQMKGHLNPDALPILVLEPNTVYFTIQYATLNFLRNDFLQYRILLENYSNEWFEMGTTNEISFSGLSQGTYKLKIMGTNHDLIWSDRIKELEIEVLPAWYQTIWFRISLFFFVIGIVGFFVNRVLQQEKLRSLELEILVDEKTREIKSKAQELVYKNLELEKVIHELSLTQSKLIQSETLASLGKMTSGIAHELNNPLNFIKNSIVALEADISELLTQVHELLKDQQNSTIPLGLLNEIDELLAAIKSGSDRAAEVVLALQQFSKMDQTDQKVDDLVVNIKNTLTMLPAADISSVKIEVDLLGQIPRILGNHGMLNQMYFQIISNALQATRKVVSPTIKIQLKVIDEKIQIKFMDNGIGMSEDQVKKAFDPFYTTSIVGKGKGLGLSLVYSIVKQHNGQIEIESEVNKGTIITVLIPIKL